MERPMARPFYQFANLNYIRVTKIKQCGSFRTFSSLILHCSFFIFLAASCAAQPLSSKKQFTHQDTLRGTITPERAWWDVLRYDIAVTPDYNTKTIQATNRLTI